MALKLRGGKTPPRIVEDLRFYSPQALPANAFNVLTDAPPPFIEGVRLPKRYDRKACRHQWVLKPDQSLLPLRAHPDPTVVYQAAACCSQCRSHVLVEVDCRGEGRGVQPCQDEMHHFLYVGKPFLGLEVGQGPADGTQWSDRQYFQCSSQRCSARLIVDMHSARLHRDWVALLTDSNLIAQRAREAVAAEPERYEGHAVPSAVDVLTTLGQYISNAMNIREVRRISGSTKRWQLCLGEPCAEMLLYLGFARDGDDWLPPRPNEVPATESVSALRPLLEDVTTELAALTLQQPLTGRDSKPALNLLPVGEELLAVMGCRDYPRRPDPRRQVAEDEEEHPFYAGLGAVENFGDDLIFFAYRRQVACDPLNSPYYLECLQGIANGRGSEKLQMEAALEASSGKSSLEEIRKAYSAFGLDSQAMLDEDTIIGNFQARIVDAPRQERDLRRALEVIGRHRDSPRIQNIASSTVTTYQQALAWLDATEDMNSEFLVTMYGAKVGESLDHEETARKCITIIAQEKNNKELKTWLDTGQLIETEMDVSAAYQRLEIGDRTLEDDAVQAAFTVALQEAPSQQFELKKALTAIAKDRNSTYLLGLAHSGEAAGYEPSEWPVGLDNIGNTCYLNSMLQCYFSIRPLRELILDFDKHKMIVEPSAMAKKKVGSRNVDIKEVERAQRFVYELQALFLSMIQAPYTHVTPKKELARLALLNEEKLAMVRRRSTLVSKRPVLGESFGHTAPETMAVLSESPESSDGSMVALPDMSDGREYAIHQGDMSSDDTLIDAPVPLLSSEEDLIMLDDVGEQLQRHPLDDKENLPPTSDEKVGSSAPAPTLIPLAEASPSRLNERPRSESPFKHVVSEQSSMDMGSDPIQAPPDRPPPIPPRQKPLDEEEDIRNRELEVARQQDVTEAIDNVLFRIECAIQAESVEETTGEQLDQIKTLFYGKVRIHTTDAQGKVRHKDDLFSSLNINVSPDIYTGLDKYFDVEKVVVGTSLEDQYTTISQLPQFLQVVFRRSQYSRELGQWKDEGHVEFPDTIYMDRYMETTDIDLLQRRQESWRWKEELARRQARKAVLMESKLEMNMPEVLSTTAEYLERISSADPDYCVEVGSELLQALLEEVENAKHELLGTEARIKDLASQMSSQFADLRTIAYRLHAVFMHRGITGSGHYWVYIYDFKAKIWRKYNDDHVTEVTDTREVFTTPTGPRPETAYFLTYVKDELVEQLTDAVCRNLAKGPEAQQDTIMLDKDVYDEEESMAAWVRDLQANEADGKNPFMPHRDVRW